jgi:hypothetical protein
MFFLDDAHATQVFELGELDAGRSYRFHSVAYGPATRFTTGASDDHVPPARPELRALSITASEQATGIEPVVQIVLDAAFDPGAALLHFTFNVDEPGQRLAIRHRPRSVVTTLDGWRTLGRPACGTTLMFAPGDRVVVSIRAIDLAGNMSLPVIREVTVERAVSTVTACALTSARASESPSQAAYRHRCGSGGVYLLLSLGICVILAGCVACVLGYLMMCFRRAREAHLAIPESVSLLVAERLARGVQRRGGVLAAVGIVGVPLLVAMNVGPLAIVSTIVGCIGLRGFVLARGVLHLIENAARVGGASPAVAPVDASAAAAPAGRTLAPVAAEVVGLTVIVRSVADEARLEVTPRALAAARRHAVPTSVARRS